MHNIYAMFYHAGMNDEDRTATQEKGFKNGGIIIATIAFGMGMNKPDVRFVLHAYLPNSIEDYYQQIGRASRDGLGADCKLFVNMGEDINFLNWMIDTNAPPVETVKSFWKYVNNKAKESNGIIRQTQETMATMAGIKTTMAGGCVGVLKRNNLMRTMERGVYEVNYYNNYLEANINFDALQTLRKSKQDKMYEMVDFINDTKTCRMVKIQNYFDEDVFMPCG